MSSETLARKFELLLLVLLLLSVVVVVLSIQNRKSNQNEAKRDSRKRIYNAVNPNTQQNGKQRKRGKRKSETD